MYLDLTADGKDGRQVGSRIQCLNKCIQTINATTKEARQEEGAKIISMAFARQEEAIAA